jgi:hypothetical protein
MQRRTAKLARRAALVDQDTLVAGVDIAKRESVVVFVRAARTRRAWVGWSSRPTPTASRRWPARRSSCAPATASAG